MTNPYVAKTVPQRFIVDLLTFLDVDITNVARIEVDYRAVRVTVYSKDEFDRLFVGIDGMAAVQTNEYPLQLWDDYMKETE
jgi:hypothetical protein